jgi:hypothetical protein
MEGSPAELSDWQLVDLTDVGVEEPVVTMYRRLVEAIETDTQPPSSGEEGRWAFEMIMAIYQSHIEQGRRVELPLTDRRHPLERWREEKV